MKNTMKAIKIDVERKQIYEVDISNIKDIANHISCDFFTTAFNLPKYDVCFVDDEGLLKPVAGWFKFDGQENPFAGHGLIVGGNAQGESRSVKSGLLDIAQRVHFSFN